MNNTINIPLHNIDYNWLKIKIKLSELSWRFNI